MARTKKIILTPKKAEKLTFDIEASKISIKEMEKEKKEIEEQIKINRLAELKELISANGNRFEDVKESLN